MPNPGTVPRSVPEVSLPTLNVSVEGISGHVAVGRQEGGSVLPLDRPESAGGTGLGFNGGHLMLLGWGACFKSTLVAAAEARDVVIERLSLAISGDLVDGPFRFSAIRMDVILEGPTSEEEKVKLITIARNGCAVSNTLARAVEMDVQLVPA